PLRVSYVDHARGKTLDRACVTKPRHRQPTLSRRQALFVGGALVVSYIARAPDSSATANRGAKVKPALTPPELDSWVAVKGDGSVVGYFGKVDIGLGIQVAIAQIIADELDVGFKQVGIVMGDTAVTINQGGASGSTGLELGAVALRNAAAQARSVLLGMASAKLGSPVETLEVSNGVVSVRGAVARRVSYGELIGGRYFDVQLQWNGKVGNELRVLGTAPLKDHAQYRVVGNSVRRADIPDKLFGREVYVTDIRVPGMLHGRMVRPPVAGAVPVKVDRAALAHLPDVQIVWSQGLLGVVAAKEWCAVKAARELRVEWSSPAAPFPAQSALYEAMAAAAPAAKGGATPVGDTKAAMAGASKIVSAIYHWPFQSHASMGPACALADVRADHATIWTGDQKPHYIRDGVAALLKLPPEKVHGIWRRGPGSYGRNDGGDAALDAAYLSKAVGKPVRVQGARADGTAWDPKGPASVHHVCAGLDAAGRVVALSYQSKGFSRENIASHPDDPTQSLTGQLTGMPLKTKQLFDTPNEGYEFANHDLGWEIVPALLDRASPLRTSHLRDPLGPQLNFASESFIDELAFATKTDPVAFRLQYLKDKRGIAVIEAAAERAQWAPRPASGERPAGEVLTGRGIAFARRKNTRVAVIAEVEVNRRTGRIWPRRWTVAHDCGLIVNPDNLRLVIEGNILHATSRALFEEVRFNERMVTSVDWLSYPILEMRDVPEEIAVVLIDHKDELPLGAGEPATRPVAAAIANAVFDATGIRLRQAPFCAARVKAAFI
ncbi:MAG TPA: molybdopterin cofactor-binding domain-containing protein, partial [Candidatus Binataceae bacterium]|nr:molybdopterin cofactor-binding domain-containing protein [Candidatus Binataceae bacterium]